jgi:hypothetical protein
MGKTKQIGKNSHRYSQIRIAMAIMNKTINEKSTAVG